MRAVIFAAGEIGDRSRIRRLLDPADLVICADGGIRHALALGLTPHLLLGDFDSAAPELLEAVAAQGVPVVRVPVEKDETDTHLALQAALERGATEIILAGGLGGRVDHLLSNLLLLPGLPAEVAVIVVDDRNLIRLLRPGGRITVPAAAGEYLSLLPLSPEVRGVVARGVRWPLDGATLCWGASLGVSNRVVAPAAEVGVDEGYLLVISSRD